MDADRVQYSDVPQLTALAQLVDRIPRYPKPDGHFANAQERDISSGSGGTMQQGCSKRLGVPAYAVIPGGIFGILKRLIPRRNPIGDHSGGLGDNA